MLFQWLFPSAAAESAALVTPSPAASAFTTMTLMEKGLLTTVLGLAGVFLVLCLFFFTIKAMQKIKE